MNDAANEPRTMPGKRYRCATCGSEVLVTRPGKLPECCGAPIEPKAAVAPPRRDRPPR